MIRFSLQCQILDPVNQDDSASLLQMTEQFCCALASDSIQRQLRLWTGLYKRKGKKHTVFIHH